MGNRLTKIYTRSGDDGLTNLGTKDRLAKDDARVQLLGELDELNCTIGLLLTFRLSDPSLRKLFGTVQQALFDLGGELCPPFHAVITAAHIDNLEQHIDEWNSHLPPLKEFVIPGGNPAGAVCHMARAICRRVERRAVTLFRQEKFNPEILRYLNRLSDVLFVAARLLVRESAKETLWEHEREKRAE